MLYLRNAAMALTCVAILGCAPWTNHRPTRAYADKNHPDADTAIVSCVGMADYVCSIIQVDQRSTWNRYTGGKTPWVRILPGTHSVYLTVLNGHFVSRASVDITDAQAGHAYNVSVERTGTNQFNGPVLTATYKDLGKVNSYTIQIGQQALKQKDVTAAF